MNFEKEQIITLDNKNDYFVFDKKEFNNTLYSLLVNTNEEDIMFVYEVEENGEKYVEMVTDESLKKNLMSLFEKEIDQEMGITEINS